MRMELQGKAYPPYRLKPDRTLANEMCAAMGLPPPDEVPPAYLLFLRGETRGANLFADLDIPRLKALHGGQRYDWFAPVGWEDELEVSATIDKLTAKESKAGPLWFADVRFDYRRVRDGVLAVREITRLVKRG
jgi:hypothetical protein